jgi:hypothetical protein
MFHAGVWCSSETSVDFQRTTMPCIHKIHLFYVSVRCFAYVHHTAPRHNAGKEEGLQMQCPWICLKWLKKTTKNFVQDSPCFRRVWSRASGERPKGPKACETVRFPQCLDSRLTGGGDVGLFVARLPITPITPGRFLVQTSVRGWSLVVNLLTPSRSKAMKLYYLHLRVYEHVSYATPFPEWSIRPWYMHIFSGFESDC